MAVLFCFMISVLFVSTDGISSKFDFDDSESTVVTNSTKTDDDEVEVKHTIVVSTKLKNNNRRGLHSSSDADPDTLKHHKGQPANKEEDSSEVPIIYGLKSVDTTRIRTPDTRFKNKVYPDSVFISRNIRDQYDTYPNTATNPMQWKPSNFFKNVNSWSQDGGNEVYHRRNDARESQGNVQFHRKITDNGMKKFYCRKCRELSEQSPVGGCVPQRRNMWVYETTTAKTRLDGKLAKLD